MSTFMCYANDTFLSRMVLQQSILSRNYYFLSSKKYKFSYWGLVVYISGGGGGGKLPDIRNFEGKKLHFFDKISV